MREIKISVDLLGSHQDRMIVNVLKSNLLILVMIGRAVVSLTDVNLIVVSLIVVILKGDNLTGDSRMRKTAQAKRETETSKISKKTGSKRRQKRTSWRESVDFSS